MPRPRFRLMRRLRLSGRKPFKNSIAGITTGDVAGVVFSNFDWSAADLKSREAKMREYIRTEAGLPAMKLLAQDAIVWCDQALAVHL